MDRNERREFVRKHRTCVFGYNRQNDGPAMTVVYYVLDGDDLLVSTMAARAKAPALAWQEADLASLPADLAPGPFAAAVLAGNVMIFVARGSEGAP